MSPEARGGAGRLAGVIPPSPGAMFLLQPSTRWSRLWDALPPALTHPHISVAYKVVDAAYGLHRLASWLSGGEIPADPAAARADLLIMYARIGGDVASLLDTDERRQAAEGSR